MPQGPKRETVGQLQYPDLVVIYLGMGVNTVTGIKTVFGFGPKISASVEAKQDGLLVHETFLFSMRHFGMRRYWRDFEVVRGVVAVRAAHPVVAPILARHGRYGLLA